MPQMLFLNDENEMELILASAIKTPEATAQKLFDAFTPLIETLPCL